MFLYQNSGKQSALRWNPHEAFANWHIAIHLENTVLQLSLSNVENGARPPHTYKSKPPSKKHTRRYPTYTA